jgi:CMP/dCMP kinase
VQNKIFQIAIDGPVGAGKSTVAKLVADKLGIVYVDTGAMYRAVGLYMKTQGMDWHDEGGVSELLEKVEISLEPPNGEKKDGRNVTVLLNGVDVSWEIRKADMGEGASVVSQYKAVREKLVSLQREMAKGMSVIMEGRDIGTKVLPNAKLKIYLDAKPIERAKRKKDQMAKGGEEITLEEAEKDVDTRDNREMNREIDPLRPADNAWIFDTTGLPVEQVVSRIAEKV